MIEIMQTQNMYVGLSNEVKPTSGIVDGTICITLDTGAVDMFYKGDWYSVGAVGGGNATTLATLINTSNSDEQD